MADAFTPDFAVVADAEVVAVGSRRQQSADEFARRHGIARAHGTYQALIDDPQVDVIYIVTPHPQHLVLAKAAIKAGKAILVEKAFTATAAGAREVADLARERGVFCMEAMWTRFQPTVVRARQLIADGAIGEVQQVQADLGAYRPYNPDDRLFSPSLGGGATLDLGVYVISIAQHFLGTPETLRARGTKYPNGVDASVNVFMEYDNGRSASVIASLQTASAGRAAIYGTAGSIELEPRFHHPTSLILRRNGADPERISDPHDGRGYAHEIAEVDQCLRLGRTESDVMPLVDTVAVAQMMQETLMQLGIETAEDRSFTL